MSNILFGIGTVLLTLGSCYLMSLIIQMIRGKFIEKEGSLISTGGFVYGAFNFRQAIIGSTLFGIGMALVLKS